MEDYRQYPAERFFNVLGGLMIVFLVIFGGIYFLPLVPTLVWTIAAGIILGGGILAAIAVAIIAAKS